MPGLGVRIYTDEHIFKDLARMLRARGYDAESCQEAGLAGHGVLDEEQLAYATRRGRGILTHDSGDFPSLDAAWKQAGREHAGIIVTPRVSHLGELLRLVERHLNTYPPDVQRNSCSG